MRNVYFKVKAFVLSDFVYKSQMFGPTVVFNFQLKSNIGFQFYLHAFVSAASICSTRFWTSEVIIAAQDCLISIS